ncbi:MAG: rhomboid family intramembrane serine protease [Geothrix sp.]|uniref:rhomboid family intramembrane serine protease n=1 Tax=Geothrix sp. TaxID=1962974 RepID=UPI00179ACE78|nr:rhomboid family intramembrane serine protease [Geothrix sp.]NWJ41215.1 rhomboid family intramembrane serine protease [Geothrix sp.]WIL20794.1 MAG: rhomboid family intramembrane serine protease [Geothrix sp.]
MDPLALTAEALREPWRLWTGHLVHFGWEHALANTLALAVPAILVRRQDRGRFLLATLVIAPLLSLALLPGLGDAQYRGASGLACALWAWVGLRLAMRRESVAPGLLMLGGLALKLSLESALGVCFLADHPSWQTLPPAHAWGALLGLCLTVPGFPVQRPDAARRI